MRALAFGILALGAGLAAGAASATPAHPLVRATPIAAAPMVGRTGADRRGAAVTSASGIAPTQMIRPALRSAAGGASVRSGGIDGGTVRRHN